MKKDKKCNIAPGDIVGMETENGYVYYVVFRIERGMLVCYEYGFDFDDGPMDFIDPAKVDHYPYVRVSADRIKSFLRYEASFEELFGKVEPVFRLRCDTDEEVVMTVGDLIAALDECKKKGAAKAKKEWLDPLHGLGGDVFGFGLLSDMYKEDCRYLFSPAAKVQAFFYEVTYAFEKGADEKSIAFLSAQAKALADELSLPVTMRAFGVEDKEDYLRCFTDRAVISYATDTELALYVRFCDELCEAGNVLAMSAKAFSLYRGDRAYGRDLAAARDLFLRLYEKTGEARYANALGEIFMSGELPGGADPGEAFCRFAVGAAGGIAESRCRLADMLLGGYGTGRNPRISYTALEEVFKDELERFYGAAAGCALAEAALRLGDIERGDNKTDGALWLYLIADLAAEMKERVNAFGGDGDLRPKIAERLDALYADPAYSKKRRFVWYHSAGTLLWSALRRGLTMQARIKRLADGEYSVSFSILKRKDEGFAPRFLIVEGDARFCGFADRVTVRTKDIELFMINGEEFDGESATVIFDEVENGRFYFCGEQVMLLFSRLRADFGVRRKKYRFASAVIPERGKRFELLCDIDDVAPGDEVDVPAWSVPAIVAGIYECDDTRTVMPVREYKSVISKVKSVPGV